MSVLRYILRISSDRLSLYMLPAKVDGEGFNNAEEVETLRREMGIRVEHDYDLVQKIIEESIPNETKIARGTPPQHGKDGYIQFIKDPSAQPKFHAGDGDHINYKDAMKISLTKKGEIVAKLHPPEKGISGSDICGNSLPAEDGKAATFTKGKGVELQKFNFIATQTGVPRFRNNVIEVIPDYEVQGNVGKETGNVRFPGSVIISGDVESDFVVEAGGDIHINGRVEAATLKAGGKIHIRGGVLGGGKANIFCENDFEATFVDSAKLVVEKNIRVKKDILHSTVMCKKSLLAGGCIIGGTITVLESLDCDELGTDTGTKTTVAVWTDYRSLEAHKNRKEIRKKTDELVMSCLKWTSRGEMPKDDHPAGEAALAETEKLMEQWKNTEESLATIEKEARSDLPEPAISVRKRIYQDVEITSPNCSNIYTTPLTGPARLVPNLSSGSLVQTHA